MTQGSDLSRDPLVIERSVRFEKAVVQSFAFLEERGFRRCPSAASDMNEIRDALITHRYVQGQRAIDVTLAFLTSQIQVVLLTFAAAATCNQNQKSIEAVDFEAWLRKHGVTGPKKLPWMRKETLWEEMSRSYNRYTANIKKDMEGAVDLLARRLQNSTFLETP